MTPGHSPEWLLTTVSAVRELMIRRLEADSLDVESKREIEMALEELDVMWEELQGQAALLLRENERYAEFFQYAPDAYLITDAGGGIREVNQAALELLQSPRDTVIGHALSEYIGDDDRIAFLTRTVNLMLAGPAKPVAWRAQLKQRGGEPMAAEFSVRAIPLKKSGVGGLCWLIRPAP
ncbi:MAG: PAS domain S-box protein [Betaproteobacteria bacterium]|jgi:PAS domain S-box-containing protein|nr:PAS domain S-box protein [Betaproteobacteria bacterium]